MFDALAIWRRVLSRLWVHAALEVKSCTTVDVCRVGLAPPRRSCFFTRGKRAKLTTAPCPVAKVCYMLPILQAEQSIMLEYNQVVAGSPRLTNGPSRTANIYTPLVSSRGLNFEICRSQY